MAPLEVTRVDAAVSSSVVLVVVAMRSYHKDFEDGREIIVSFISAAITNLEEETVPPDQEVGILSDIWDTVQAAGMVETV